MHKYNGKYYFSYSTGDTHFLCYATSDTLYGPFTYQGVILTPVIGWTTHHSICEFKGKWYLFHHDSQPSGGRTWLRIAAVVVSIQRVVHALLAGCIRGHLCGGDEARCSDECGGHDECDGFHGNSWSKGQTG